MESANNHQLTYYVALAAPAARAPAEGTEAFMRPEIGFTPAWFHGHCGIDFSRRWHEEPDYRLETHTIMREQISRHNAEERIKAVCGGMLSVCGRSRNHGKQASSDVCAANDHWVGQSPGQPGFRWKPSAHWPSGNQWTITSNRGRGNPDFADHAAGAPDG